MRLDHLLVVRGLFASRSRARDAIVRGTVSVDGKIIHKSGHDVGVDAPIQLDDPARGYVSRAALKLKFALDHFSLTIEGKNCLDIGASTGGFSQVLLERGAAHIIAVDVGHDQLHPSLRGLKNITLYEGLNARALERHHLGSYAIDIVVSDVSFISLKLSLPPALGLAEVGAQAILLIKPQFEAGRAALGRDGLLKDPLMGEKIARNLYDWLGEQPGWRALGLAPSPISGGKGATEFLLYGTKDKP